MLTLRRAALGALAACAVLGGPARGAVLEGDAGYRHRAALAEVFRDLDGDRPGCAAGVIENGRLVFAGGFGRASLEQGTPITPRTVFDLGSIAKQFMAATVVLLAQEGRVDLDADVRRYLPELPQIGPTPVTLRAMLHHTSGLRDYVGLLLLAGWRFEDGTTPADALALLARQRGLDFPPGSRFAYCDTNFFLLSQVVERATGTPWRALAEARLFRPLGMGHSEVLDDPARVVRGRATSYDPRGDGFAIDASDWSQTGDGGVQSSVEDLVHWDANFYDGRVGGARLLRALLTPGRLADGTPIGYGMGLFVNEYRGLPRVEHSGSWEGFRAALTRFPEQRTTVMALCNVASADAVGRVDRMADVVLAERFHDRAAAPGGAAAPPDGGAPAPAPAHVDLAAYPGAFAAAELGVVWRIELREGGLVLRHRAFDDPPLVLVGRDTFRAGPVVLRFAAGGAPRTTFDVAMDDTHDLHFVRRPEETPR